MPLALNLLLDAEGCARVEALRGRQGQVWPEYRPGWWVPHCTLAMPLSGDEAGRAVTALDRTDLPFDVAVAEMAWPTW
jgi:hypothetical protein